MLKTEAKKAFNISALSMSASIYICEVMNLTKLQSDVISDPSIVATIFDKNLHSAG